MPKILQHRRATSIELDTIIGDEGEIFVDLDKNTLRLMDGQKRGGYELLNIDTTTFLEYDKDTKILKYTGIHGEETNIDLTNLLDDTTNTILSGTLEGNNLKFNREDGTYFYVDVTELFDNQFTEFYKTKLDSIEHGATADQTKEDIDSLGIDAATVNGLTVNTSVPENAVFTDTETTTDLIIVGNELKYTNEEGNTSVIDLSLYLDDTNLARIINGSYDSVNKELVFTRDDSSEFRIDSSMFFDDTNLVTSVNGETGDVIITPYDDSGVVKYTDTLSDVTTDNKIITQIDMTNYDGALTITESQITDLKNYELADPTILKESDISLTVQPFNSDTVIDGDYKHIDITETSVTDGVNTFNKYIHPDKHIISEIDGLQTELDSKVNNSRVLTDVPENAVFTDTETTTDLIIVGNELKYTNEEGNTSVIDLSLYLDDTNLARIINGSYDSVNKELVFTRDDSSEFRIDSSMFFDDTNLVTSVNGETGAINLTASDVGAAEITHTHVISDIINLQNELNNKQDNLISGTNIKTLNGNSLIGNGDLHIDEYTLPTDAGADKFLSGDGIYKEISNIKKNKVISGTFTDDDFNNGLTNFSGDSINTTLFPAGTYTFEMTLALNGSTGSFTITTNKDDLFDTSSYIYNYVIPSGDGTAIDYTFDVTADEDFYIAFSYVYIANLTVTNFSYTQSSSYTIEFGDGAGSKYLADNGTYTDILSVVGVNLGPWKIEEQNGILYFVKDGIDVMSLDESGNIITIGDITAFGTITR